MKQEGFAARRESIAHKGGEDQKNTKAFALVFFGVGWEKRGARGVLGSWDEQVNWSDGESHVACSKGLPQIIFATRTDG